MKAFLLFLTLGIGVCFSNNSYSQSTKISLNLKNKTIKQVFSEIEKTSEFIFFYQDDILDVNRKVTVSADNETVEQILNEILSATGNTYFVSDRSIYITKVASKTTSEKTAQQRRKIEGIVMDKSGETLIGANILEKGTSRGTVSDMDGKFTFECDNNTILQVSYIGYKTRDVRVGDLGYIEIILESESTLDEVVVVGAGTQKKVSVTGAITSVRGSELYAPSSSLTNNLAGKLSGVISVTNSGEPGSTSQFYIRGISTFGGRTTPLILLDGVEISSGDLNNIPPESIESFSILKDASATAIYGARGANGVMLITTKSGLENTTARINVSFEQSMLQPVNTVDYADGVAYMETYNVAQLSRNSSLEPRYSEMKIENTRNHVNEYVFPDVDYSGLMFKDYTSSQRGNINVQGGGSKVVYYMNLQVNHDGGLLNIPKNYSFDNNYQRWLYTFQNNIGYKVTPTTNIDLRMNAQISRQKSPNLSAEDIFQQIYMNNPVAFPATFPKEKGDEHIKFGSAVMSAGRFFTNPYANMLNTFRETNANKLNVSVNLDQKLNFITEGLSLTSLINFNNWSQSYYTRSLTPFLYGVKEDSWNENDPSQFSLTRLQEGTEYISQSGITRNSDNTFYFDSRINYNHRFGNHSVTGMLMYMMREFRSDVLPHRNQGFSGRATYDYKNKYLAEFNFGYNGTERLAKGERFEFFPAMSLGWVVSNETFWKNLNVYIDYFKIRGSYGLVGSDETGLQAGAPHFLYLNTVNMYGGYSFNSGYTGNYSLQGPIVNTYSTLNSHWERSRQFDIGADFRFLNQIDFTLDYYHYKRDRILMQRASFPSILGYSDAIPWANIGEVDNKGMEISMNWRKQLTSNFSFDIRGNYTYAKNKYTYVDEPDYPYSWQTNTGKPLSYTRGYIAEGLFKDETEIQNSPDQSLFGSKIMPGDIKYRDINSDGKITSEDQVMLSSYGNIPRIQYGFGISTVYKKLDFSVFFNGSAKRKIMLSDVSPFSANDSNDRNLMKWISDGYWKEDGSTPNAIYPRLGVLSTQISNNLQPSSFWMRNGNFLRFKTLEIGYTLSKCRIYFSGDNLAVWSPFSYWDPELWFNTYPLQRTFNLGVQFKF